MASIVSYFYRPAATGLVVCVVVRPTALFRKRAQAAGVSGALVGLLYLLTSPLPYAMQKLGGKA